MGTGPEGQGGGGRIPELISTNEKPKKTGPLSPAGKQDCPSLICTHSATHVPHVPHPLALHPGPLGSLLLTD